MDISVVIRTLNEARHLELLLSEIEAQEYPWGSIETVVVDSGSSDGTLEIAKRRDVNLIHICKEDFSFGRSLNVGCDAASGDALVFVSGHCIPASKAWLSRLVAPLADDPIVYSYGKQIGGETSHFSEKQIFRKYFPDVSQIPQQDFYVNNANSALLKRVWANHPFDEDLTGLEDMHLARWLVEQGYQCAYVAEAPVYHLHDETWRQVRRRFERESIALQHIMPEVHLSFSDFLRYAISAIFLDFGAALREHCFSKVAPEIVLYRFAQFWGAYRGNHIHRNISKQRKEAYFYPR